MLNYLHQVYNNPQITLYSTDMRTGYFQDSSSSDQGLFYDFTNNLTAYDTAVTNVAGDS